jgi:voltage-gated potassium channel
MAAAGMAIVETEHTISSGREQLFRTFEVVFGVIFLLEYAGRIWIARENPKFSR